MLEIKLVIQEDGHNSLIKEFSSEEQAVEFLVDRVIAAGRVEKIEEVPSEVAEEVKKDKDVIKTKKSLFKRVKK